MGILVTTNNELFCVEVAQVTQLVKVALIIPRMHPCNHKKLEDEPSWIQLVQAFTTKKQNLEAPNESFPINLTSNV